MSDDWRHWPVDEWAAVRGLLDHALRLPPDQRARWLDTLQGDQAVHRDRLRALLDHAEAAAGFETLPKVETSSFAPANTGQLTDATEQAGALVGPYRLLRSLGEGGMASVWLAERTDQLQGRQVALKLPHGTWRRAALAQRLAREREILATLEHPHIARLYDAGVTPAGQPFLALEWVDGLPLDRWCALHAPTLRERLALFLQVCDAVAHAHAHLVVHRDLKPGNILVDQAGQVRLLDFGIAKLLEGDHAAETALTREVGRAFTPEYASPEQIAGHPISTATDIYALGVVLFELLVGRRPYALQGGTRARWEQSVLESEPARPSALADTTALRKTLQGDLDTIVLKALKKSPAERYDSARALADDLRRHLADQPVLARPDSAAYRWKKWLKRHRVTATAAAVAVLSLLGGTGMAVWQARSAGLERDRSEQVRHFIESIFRDADPYRDVKGPPTVAALLERARQRAAGELAATPDLHVHLLDLVGQSLKNLQNFDGAARALDEAVTVGRQKLGDTHPETLAARISRLGLYRMQGRSDDALKELESLLPTLRLPNADPAMLSAVLQTQAAVAMDQARHADAAAAAAESLEIGLRRLGERHEGNVHAAISVALAHEFLRQPQKARQAAEQALRLSLLVHQGNSRHADTISARAVLARSAGELGDLKAAVAQFDQVILDADEHFGAGALESAFFRANQVKFLLESGQGPRAVEVARQALQAMSQRADPGSHFVPSVRARLAQALIACRRIDGAVAELRPALRDLLAVQGLNHPMVRAAQEDLALALAYRGQVDEARTALGDLSAGVRALRVRAMLARLGRQHEAALAYSGQALAAAVGPRADIDRMRVLPERGLGLLDAGQPEQALLAFSEASTLMDRYQVRPSAERAEVWLGQARAHLALGQVERALPLLRQADAFWRDFDGADPRFGAEAARWLAQAQAGTQR